MDEQVRRQPDGCRHALSEAYDTALLDLDGVVYAGGQAIEHAVESLTRAREGGMHLAYVTNNAARTPQAVADQLSGFGLPTGPDDVITSAQAVARLISEQVPPGARVLAIGGEGLRVALRERGLEPVFSADDDPAAVVQGYDPSLDWERLAEAAYAVQRGVPWFASNTDLTIPKERGIAPGNGALVEVVRIAAGGAPQVAGKPQPPMHRETVLRTGARRPLVIGDRLDTDIEGACNGEVDSLLVLTGVTTPAELLAAPPRHRPTYVDEDLRGLLAPQPEVTAADGGFRCGGWRAEAAGDTLLVEGEGTPLDGLRALCAAAWTAAGDSSYGADTGKALARIGR
ncbi:HAD-IIA family hydrolase [Streptomyces sp. Je 1-4]|uniref:HAD-IIA family hydrolase n=1 Tax=Streptomyces TaxID=1883 RepID=UPI0021D81011|nr:MULTISPECIES: HAD-IIA family hydrolase [unclassified Streptomyces]UYB44995.1 HAD-IIA family hydrolase [Streptomyces sp. Je 1-4]UZQ39544.1 HAD-IIA family hydrolase [Streptomyces sp. Je 1-4] [Streptomyces sp. Je 1-4 4N24]UZQ46961.1 HAD-IIA family hydrolase [Streptomyces sp. Je 1-4] [Streptomyces sp. Je 1-4 4N24_ara]